MENNIPLYLGPEALQKLAWYIKENDYSAIFVLTDDNTSKHCLNRLEEFVPAYYPIRVKSGEKHKDLKTCAKIWKALKNHYADRKALLINLGGGVIMDMGGFAAATYKRGIDFVNVPTTLLGMVDAAIGGKLAVDFEGVKNMIGLFREPKAVFIDTEFLDSLPKRDLRAAFAEIVKHGIVADPDLWNDLQLIKLNRKAPLQELVQRSIEIKRRITIADPLEMGQRKILNFGHSIGHALEGYSIQHDKKPLLHGEAVAAGMISEAYLSYMKCGLSKEELDQITQYIDNNFPHYDIKHIYSADILEYMKNDKKNKDQEYNFALISAIGKPTFDQVCSRNEIIEALGYYILHQ